MLHTIPSSNTSFTAGLPKLTYSGAKLHEPAAQSYDQLSLKEAQTPQPVHCSNSRCKFSTPVEAHRSMALEFLKLHVETIHPPAISPEETAQKKPACPPSTGNYAGGAPREEPPGEELPWPPEEKATSNRKQTTKEEINTKKVEEPIRDPTNIPVQVESTNHRPTEKMPEGEPPTPLPVQKHQEDG